MLGRKVMSRYLRILLVFALISIVLVSAQVPGVTRAQAENKLEVFSWWTSGGEAAALNALFDAYKKVNPDTEIINATIAGGAGTNAKAVLQTRLQGNNPPDTWQVHPGWELQGQYVDPGYVEPITDLYTSEGWDKVLPQGFVKNILTSQDGQIYIVLTGVHRNNGLWYNKKVLDKNGITIGATLSFDDFFAAADKYMDLFTGKLAFDDPSVKKAMDTFAKLLDYQNSDHSALSWDQAVKKLIEGSCVFNSMGDWAYGEFVNAKQQDNVDFGWVNFPGTDGAFSVVADGFVLAKNAPHKDNTLTWLKVLGSKEAQEAFNPLKGSIPIRSDVDRTKFGPYHNWSMDSFAKDKQVPSVVQGSAAPASFQQALYDATVTFVTDKNTDAFAKALVQAAKDAGFAQ
jgi:glucose/mannose transport system substrate-binding protein